ncbi:MAG: hypothetical protein HY331_06130 [Chloroflexi bacterium]|nr:hypothetical protein [Chloroflexota bacterium]
MARATALTPGDVAADFLECFRLATGDEVTAAALSYDEAARAFCPIAAVGPRAGEYADSAVPMAVLPMAMWLRLVERRQPLILADTSAAGDAWAVLSKHLPTLATARCYGVWPLVSGNGPIGAAVVRNDRPLALGPERVRLLTGLGRALAGALQNARAAAEAQAEQIRTEEALERVSRSKRHLLSVASHDLRTPLTAVRGFSEMIRDEDFGMEEIKEFADSINKSARRLNGMISDLLDLDRMESGRLTLNLEAIDLNATIADVVGAVRPDAPNHSIALQLDDAIPLVSGDPERLAQVITHIVNNAVQYSPDGGEIVVGSRLEGDVAHVRVQDQGIGMSPESLETVFDRYARLDPESKRHIRGIGLGLPLVRLVVEKHGGKVWAERAPGRGTIFRFTIPLWR